MAKFKTGDVIEDILGCQATILSYDYITNQYELNFNGVKHKQDANLIDNICKIISPNQTTAQPVQPIQYNNTRFKLGDIAINTKGTVIKITLVNIARQKYSYEIIKHNDPTKIGKLFDEDIQFADAWWKKEDQYVKDAKQLAVNIKPCTCDSKVLFNKGCQCGSVVPYKAKFK